MSVAISASWNCMAWNSTRALPNCLRSLACFTAWFHAPSASPSICAPIPMRPSFSVSIAILYPLPTSPSTCAAATTHSSRISSHVLDARMPSLSSLRPT
jgi:hypothetical protein